MLKIILVVFVIFAATFKVLECKKSNNLFAHRLLIPDIQNHHATSFNSRTFDLNLQRFPAYSRDHVRSILSALLALLNLQASDDDTVDHDDVLSLSCPDEGVKMIPHVDSCQKFTLCLNGMELTQSCAEDFEFSRERSNCVPKTESDCEDPDKPEKFECQQNSTAMSFIPNTENCSKYFLCLPGGSQFPMSCPDDLHWSIDAERCMDPDEAECESDTDREFCPKEGFRQISHPESCKKFIACFNGIEAAEMSCPAGLHFSRESRSCADPQEAGCDNVELSCPAVDDPNNLVFLPHPDECSKYFVCFRGSQHPLQW